MKKKRGNSASAAKKNQVVRGKNLIKNKKAQYLQISASCSHHLKKKESIKRNRHTVTYLKPTHTTSGGVLLLP